METLNWPVTSGCTNIGGGCESCPSLWEYREKGWDYSVKMHKAALPQPLQEAKPKIYTVALGSDLFHGDVSREFIGRAFEVMNECRHHFFEIATKRPERAERIGKSVWWSDNIALGVTVEDAKAKWRINNLRATPAVWRFVSFLPLLGKVGKLNLDTIHAATIGAEDWGLKRPCQGAWVEGIKKQCIDQGVELSNHFRFYEGVEQCQE